FATRRERDFRVPADFEIGRYLGRPPWQIGEVEGEARIEVGPDTAWWVERAYGNRGRFEDGVFVTEYSSIPLLATWVLRQEGRAVPLEPEELRREVAEALERVLEAHEGEPPEVAPPAKPKVGDEPPARLAGPVAPERFAVLQARAIRAALDFVGPGIAAEAHSAVASVRRKLEETFGQFELPQTPEPEVATEEERLIATFTDAIHEHRLVEVEYQKEGEQTWS